MKTFIHTLYKRHRVLTLLAIAHLGLALLFALAIQLDTGAPMILGISRWIKPTKFALSIAVYTATMAWILGEFPKDFAERAGRRMGWMLAGEMVLITMQSLRGVPSHFNQNTPFNGAVFTAMGLMIFYNTILAAQTLRQTWRAPSVRKLAPGYLMGIRIGLVCLILGSIQGMHVSSPLAGGHTVGAPEGGAGLPFLNWSTQAGDLRVFHFLALHGLQLLLLMGLLWPRKPKPVIAGFTLYLALSAATLWQALHGVPLWAGH